ncbi:hypothetical protein J2741_000914 [Methanolinea mesophila]|uniref:hypothetical protein n=1 Tax=Methanolinea mesophila TaxID=547055 RepID=UPI001AE1D275|nr:hypothetical protein [Methanolinea mesophila]MBP1928367.1 hypothetical protein [Methanolinea mesophila]
MDPGILQIVELTAAAGASLAALWQHSGKKKAEERAGDVISFFDPGDEKITSPPAAVPGRSWKMTDETRRWVICGHSQTDQASLLQQICNAEAEKKINYVISVPGAYYEIEYGLIKGGGMYAKKGAG